MADSMGNRIKYARELKNMSQADVSHLTGISKGTISTVERDPDPNITIQHLVKLCKTLGVSAEYILFGNTEERSDEWKRLSHTKEGIGLRQIILNLHKQKVLTDIVIELGKLSKHDSAIVLNLVKNMNGTHSS
jgi:transcriptional regulator with XRE-family HTH domain